MQKAITLIQVADNQIVDAVLATLNQEHLDSFEALWKPRLQASNEEDHHWDWEKKNKATGSNINYEKYAIECGQITQGLMIIEIDFHRSQLMPNKSIVYVDFLATAPWNRPSICNPPQYRGVGSVLLQFARLRSMDLGYGGIVGLHSLPSAESFYDKQKMTNLGVDLSKQNLTYFEG